MMWMQSRTCPYYTSTSLYLDDADNDTMVRLANFAENSQMLQESDFSYCRSSQLHFPVQIQVDSPIHSFVTIDIVQSNNIPVCNKSVINHDWLKFDIDYSELLLGAVIRVTVFEKRERNRVAVKQGLFKLFNKKK